jgi:hypothetical protein
MRIKLSMAVTRESFKNKLREYLSGALREFYSSKIGSEVGLQDYIAHWNTEGSEVGLQDYIAHWNTEVERLINVSFWDFFFSSDLKFKDTYQSRYTAYLEVKQDLIQKNQMFVTKGESHVNSVIKSKKYDLSIRYDKTLIDFWKNEFWDTVEEAIKPEAYVK